MESCWNDYVGIRHLLERLEFLNLLRTLSSQMAFIDLKQEE